MINLNTTKKYILFLEKENKNLKEDFKRHIDRINELTNRIDKAIEYIEEHIKYENDNSFNGMQFYSYHLYDFEKDELLDILKGSDKE